MIAEKSLRLSMIPYHTRLTVFMGALVLTLFALVDIRRGFLFSDYFKVGSPSTLFNFAPGQLPMVLIGAFGIWITFKSISRMEAGLKKRQVT